MVEYGIETECRILAQTPCTKTQLKRNDRYDLKFPDLPYEGHIGIYIGSNEVDFGAANTKAGVIRNKLEDTAWTHWLKIPYINYVEKQEESQ